MRIGRGILLLSLAALLGACQQPASLGPSGDGVGVGAPRFQVLQVTNDAETRAMEDAIVVAINGLRAAHGLAGLANSDTLRDLARVHSQDMITRNFYSHTNPDGKSPYQRLQDAKLSVAAWGETIHYSDTNPKNVVDDWARHPGGYAYMLNSRFTAAGVGVVHTDDQTGYRVTALFVRPALGQLP